MLRRRVLPPLLAVVGRCYRTQPLTNIDSATKHEHGMTCAAELFHLRRPRVSESRVIHIPRLKSMDARRWRTGDPKRVTCPPVPASASKSSSPAPVVIVVAVAVIISVPSSSSSSSSSSSFGFFQGAIDTWQASVTKKNGGIFGRSPYEDVERSEHTVARRMDEVNSVLETCGLRQNAGKLVILPNLRRTVENRKFSRRMQEYQMKASHRFLGIVYPAMLSMGADIDQRIWATNCAWRELCGMWWNKRVPYKIKRALFRGAVCGASFTGLTALLLHDRDYLRLQRCLEKKLRTPHARHGLLGRTGQHKDTQLSPSVEKVAAGASCIQVLCTTKAQMVPGHCQRARTSCTSSMMLVWPNALRIARHTH